MTREERKAYDVKRLRKRQQEMFDFMIEMKEASPCTDCGMYRKFYMMEFDHVRGVKEFNLSDCNDTMVGFVRFLDELAKCELVCSCCHKRRTYMRYQTQACLT